MTNSGTEAYRNKALVMIENKGCRYLGEIECNDEEYIRICKYAHQAIRYTADLTQQKVDLLLSIAIVQIAKRNPDPDNFWDVFFTEIDEERTEDRVDFAGNVFLRTMMYYKFKVIHTASENCDWALRNILWHAYGSDLTKRSYRFMPLETLFHYMNNLYEKDFRDFPIEDLDQYKKSLEKLNKRVTRELKKKKYVGDIRINDSEYELLKMYMHYTANQILRDSVISGESLFAVAAVQIAIKSYKAGNLWGNFFHEIKTKTVGTIEFE